MVEEHILFKGIIAAADEIFPMNTFSIDIHQNSLQRGKLIKTIIPMVSCIHNAGIHLLFCCW
jgi:hypothetical protein